MRGERGQTTAEYMGLLVVVAAIVAGVVSLDLPGRLAEMVGDAVCVGFSDEPGVNCGPQAEERFDRAARGDEPSPGQAPPSRPPRVVPRLDRGEARAAPQGALPALPGAALPRSGSQPPLGGVEAPPGAPINQALRGGPFALSGPLATLATPPPASAQADDDGEDGGNLIDGGIDALGALKDEVVDTGKGVVRHVNIFDPDATARQWQDTAGVAEAIYDDPLGAAESVAQSFTAPIEQAYREGGLDQAIGHGLVSGAGAVVGGKGLTKLGKLDRAAPQAPDAPTPRPDQPTPTPPDRAPDRRRDCPTGAPANSFAAPTPVLMADGTHKAIASVGVGDKVIATDPTSGRAGPRVVTHRSSHPKRTLRLSAGGETLTTTADHPFWNATDSAWQTAHHLRPGDRLATSRGDLVALRAISAPSSHTRMTYNLTVQGTHTYHVGRQGLLVHNACHGSTGTVPSGVRNASPGLRQLFSDGSIRGRPIIGIRSKLTERGFSQQRLSNDRRGYRFDGPGGENVRIRPKGGGWEVRVQNRDGNYLDEYGNVADPGATHGIYVRAR